MKSILLGLLLSTCSTLAQTDRDFSRFIRAIHVVEAQGRFTTRRGDHGKALGPLQIHYKYWADAVEYDPSLGGKYSDCKNLGYSVKVVNACFRRYAPAALARRDWKTLARIHNGGPDGHTKRSTLKYWDEVKKNLQ